MVILLFSVAAAFVRRDSAFLLVCRGRSSY